MFAHKQHVRALRILTAALLVALAFLINDSSARLISESSIRPPAPAARPSPAARPAASPGARFRTARGAAQMDAAQRPRLQALVGNLRNMSQQSLDFWLEHGLDAQYGGFHAVGGERLEHCMCWGRPPAAARHRGRSCCGMRWPVRSASVRSSTGARAGSQAVVTQLPQPPPAAVAQPPAHEPPAARTPTSARRPSTAAAP